MRGVCTSVVLALASLVPALAVADAPPPASAPDESSVSTEPAAPSSAPASSAQPSSTAHGLYTHDGFYLRYALGGAFIQMKGTTAYGPNLPFSQSGAGVAEILAIGGTVPDGLVIAGAASALVSKDAVIGNYGVLVDWFPAAHDGWHVGSLAGLGLERTTVSIAGSGVGSRATSPGLGFGATLLGGYDAWVTPQFSLGIDAMGSTVVATPKPDSGFTQLHPWWAGIAASVLYH